MRTLSSVAALLAAFAALGLGQCSDSSTSLIVFDGFNRTTGNQLAVVANGYVTGNYSNTWSVSVSATITLDTTTLNSGNASGTTSAAVNFPTYTLSMTGPGTYREADTYTFQSTCGDYVQYSFGPSSGGQYVVISLPTITPPNNNYGAGNYAFWYFNGIQNPDGYATTAQLVGSGVFGNCSSFSSCTPSNPTYTWAGVNRPNAISFSTTSGTTTTITSQAASNGGVYDVSLNFSVDGFTSAALSLNLNTPNGMYNDTSASVGYADGCSSANGYDSTYQYVAYDLWTNALSQITVNELNDQFSADTNGIVGWYLGAWTFNDVWSPADWDDPYHFTDHLSAYDCDATWNPLPVSPQNLNSKVFHVPQTWYVGSATTANGVSVRADTQQYYTDHGTAQ